MSFVDEMERFSFNGAATLRQDRVMGNQGSIPYLVNEFWTAGQREGHSLHEVSYRACFKPQLPEFLIQRLTRPGEAVFDPFMGRGTTPLQAALMGRRAIASDINPLSAMLCRPRLATPEPEQVAERLASLDWRANTEAFPELLAFYHPDTLRQIVALRHYLLERDAHGRLDTVDDWIRMVAINRLTGHSPGFFSVYSLPPNQAVSVERQRKINRDRGQTPPQRDVPALILKKTRALLKDGGLDASASLYTAPSSRCVGVRKGSITLTVTSPPFLDVVDYAGDNWLRCWFAGIDAKAVPIAIHRKLEDWRTFTHATLKELARMTRPGGHIAYEVGEVRNGKVELDHEVLAAAEDLPLRPVAVLVNVQEFTKTANCWGVSNNRAGTNSNRIVVLERA